MRLVADTCAENPLQKTIVRPGYHLRSDLVDDRIQKEDATLGYSFLEIRSLVGARARARVVATHSLVMVK